MIQTIKKHLKNFFKNHSYGFTVVNCTYYRSMPLDHDGYSRTYLQDEHYYTICEQIKHANH